MAYKICRTVTRTEYLEIPIKTMLRIFSGDCWGGSELQQFNKISAIKETRTTFNIGLKDAKELVEQFMEMVFNTSSPNDIRDTPQEPHMTAPGSSYRSFEPDGEYENEHMPMR